jgi:hypothetical protein
MKRLVIVLVLVVMLVVPVMADVDSFYITTLYGSPTHYIIDYGTDTTAESTVYTIESSTALIANNTWLLLGSNDATTITELDEQISVAFAAGVGQDFSITTPAHYRYYYLILETGFYNPASVLNLTLYSGVNSTAAATTSGPMVFDGGDAGNIGIGIVGCVGVLGLLGLAIRRKD